MKLLVVNLFGGPGAGKSLMAADIFTRLKRAGIQAEIPPEVAKIHAQRGDSASLGDQIKLFADTQHQLAMTARSEATVAIMDSPILMTLAYAPKPYFASFPELVKETVDQYNNLNFFLKRSPTVKYSNVGRVHSEAEAIAKDNEIIINTEMF